MARDEHTYGFSQPDAIDLVNMIGGEESIGVDPMPATRQPAIFQTPSGGIPARSGTSAGSAVCTMFYIDGGTIATTGRSHTVYNIFASEDVAGDAYIVASPAKGGWVVISEDCP